MHGRIAFVSLVALFIIGIVTIRLSGVVAARVLGLDEDPFSKVQRDFLACCPVHDVARLASSSLTINQLRIGRVAESGGQSVDEG